MVWDRSINLKVNIILRAFKHKDLVSKKKLIVSREKHQKLKLRTKPHNLEVWVGTKKQLANRDQEEMEGEIKTNKQTIERTPVIIFVEHGWTKSWLLGQIPSVVILVLLCSYGPKRTNIIMKANIPNNNVSKTNYPRKPTIPVLGLNLPAEAVKLLSEECRHWNHLWEFSFQLYYLRTIYFDQVI